MISLNEYNIATLFAKAVIFPLKERYSKSLINKRNNVMDSTETCGTPDFTIIWTLKVLEILTC